jgi:hypothetical protein
MINSLMAKITLAFGSALIVLGILGFVLTGSQHYTALIPAAFGVLLELFGVMALNPKLRMHAMHGAVLVGLIGFAGTIGSVGTIAKIVSGAAITAPEGRTVESVRDAAIAKFIMAVLMAIYVVLCVRSFIAARKARAAAQ